MRQWKLMMAVILILPAALIAGCIEDTEQRGDMKFVDPLGDEVVLNTYPERIVTLSPALTETVFALGSGNRVVATDDTSNYPPEAESLPGVFTYQGLDLEELVSLYPDLVIMDKTLDWSEEAYNAIKNAGIPVYRIYPLTIEEVLDSIAGIGEIIDEVQNATTLIEDFRARMDAIDTRIIEWDEVSKPKVLLVTYYDGTMDPFVADSSTMAGGLIEGAGGKSAVLFETGIVTQVTVEVLVEADPDMIICTQSSSFPTETKEKILSDPRWEDISAVKEERVFEVDGDIVDRTGPRLISGMEEIHCHIRDYVEE